VAVLGDGVVGWSAAAALKKALPAIEVTVLGLTGSQPALAETITSTLPSAVEFHSDLGLSESDILASANSGIRLGTRFLGWGPDPYIHAYCDYGPPMGSAAFHQHWLRAERGGRAEAFDTYSLAAVMGSSNRFVPPQAVAAASPQRFAFGLHIDPVRYREMMHAFALHLGAIRGPGEVAEVVLDPEDGFVASLRLSDGTAIKADLYVDCGGPGSPLRVALGGGWEDWSSQLLCDRVLVADVPVAEPEVLENVGAIEGGWTWRSSGPEGGTRGLVYSSRHLSDGAASDLMWQSGATTVGSLRIRQGRWAEPWTRNCVAIGDCAVGIEPLEWTNLHLAHSGIDRLVAMMPDREFNPVELWDYNRQSNDEADRIRDFLVMHYVTARGGKAALWQDAAAVPLPDSLAHTLTQFSERGRLPFYDEETFSRDSWVAVLLGQGVRPRRIDPLVDTVAEKESLERLAQMHQSISRWVDSLPPYTHFLQAIRQRVA
jgi:tryptophan halogenase